MHETRVIAVLDFEQEGFIGGDRLGGFAADELTSALFIKRKLKVVDRVLIKAKMLEMNIDRSAMTVHVIRSLASMLNADCFVLGKIVRTDSENIEPAANVRIRFQISFRILSAKDGSVIGMVTKRLSKKGDIQQILSDAIYKMAEEVRPE